MKNLTLIFYLILAVFAASCQSAYVALDNDEDGEFVVGSSGGRMTPERYIDIKNREYASMSIKELESQLRAAIRAKNLTLADSLQNLINTKTYQNGYSRTTGVKQIRLKIQNDSDKIIKILSGPFTGTVLNPKETTTEARGFDLGIYILHYRVYKIGASNSYPIKSNVPIREGRGNIIIY